MDRESIRWILERIKWVEAKTHPSWSATRKCIYAGCYDVWSCEQDRLDSVEIPKRNLQEAKDLGYISSVKNKYNDEVYSITEKGNEFYNDSTPNLL